MRAVGDERIVIVSNYTQTLDIIGQLCREHHWPLLRLDGTTSLKKRQKMVDEFNDPMAQAFAFLLSSKAGGCGLNLIGGSRLVLFDPDWNPAIDKQAAARVWRDGQKRRCFIYRFVTTGTIEEKIFMRQLSKEGLQSIVEDKQQVNTLSTKDLRKLFLYNDTTASETHLKLSCRRCPPENKIRGRLLLKQSLCTTNGGKESSSTTSTAAFTTGRRERVKSLVGELKEWPKYEELRRTMGELASLVAAEGGGGVVVVGDGSDCLDLDAVILRLEGKEFTTLPGFSKFMLGMFSQCRKRVVEGGLQQAQADVSELGRLFQHRWASIVPQLIALQDEDENEAPPPPPPQGNDSGGNEVMMEVVEGADGMQEKEEEEEEGGGGGDLTTCFQPQVEMPLEEDLKNWSHHWTVKTADDPVMKQALQGREEAISFLFGLEVTWDLLQRFPQPEAKPRERPVVSKDDDDGGSSGSSSDEDEGGASSRPPPKRGRGRPKKEAAAQPAKRQKKAPPTPPSGKGDYHNHKCQYPMN